MYGLLLSTMWYYKRLYTRRYEQINLTINMEFGGNMKKITLKEMLKIEVNDILTNYSSGGHTYFYKNGEGEYHEIVELDLFRGRFITDDGDFSEFEWELEESHIYME